MHVLYEEGVPGEGIVASNFKIRVEIAVRREVEWLRVLYGWGVEGMGRRGPGVETGSGSGVKRGIWPETVRGKFEWMTAVLRDLLKSGEGTRAESRVRVDESEPCRRAATLCFLEASMRFLCLLLTSLSSSSSVSQVLSSSSSSAADLSFFSTTSPLKVDVQGIPLLTGAGL